LDPVTSGNYTTSIAPLPKIIGLGTDKTVIGLFQHDYPKDPDGNPFTYQYAKKAIDGTLTISTLKLFRNGDFGGLNIVASLSKAVAPHTFRWIQYASVDPAPTADKKFLGEDRSPFTDPPQSARDEKLPFYWTNEERDNEGKGYVKDGNINNDIRFNDGPFVGDSHADSTGVFKNRFDLFLTDYDVTDPKKPTVTIYEGIEYGYTITKAAPEPSSLVMIVSGLIVLAGLRSVRAKGRVIWAAAWAYRRAIASDTPEIGYRACISMCLKATHATRIVRMFPIMLLALVMLPALAGCGTPDSPATGDERPGVEFDVGPSSRAFVHLRYFGDQTKSFPNIVITPDPGRPNPDLEHLTKSDHGDVDRFALPKAKFATLWIILNARRDDPKANVKDGFYEWILGDSELLRFRLGQVETLELLKRTRQIADQPGSPFDGQLVSLIARLSPKPLP
jgi:hypothetical protein